MQRQYQPPVGAIDSMAFQPETVKGTPWEKVGHGLPPNASVDETLKLAGLDWGVVKRQAWVDTVPVGLVSEEAVQNVAEAKGPVQPARVPGNYVLLRDDTSTPISPFVGVRYKPIQNTDAFRVFHDFCEAGNMTMETAGSLFGGQHIWGLARINGDYRLCDGELICGYFLLMQSHVYGSALKAMFTPVRYPGGHTMVQPVNRKLTMKRTYTMSHSRLFNEARIKEIKEVMGVAQTMLMEFVNEATILSQTKVTEKEAIAYFIQTFQPELHNKIKQGGVDVPDRLSALSSWDEANRNLKKAPTYLKSFAGADLDTCKDTAWGLLQATNYAYDHVIGQGTDTRLVASWMGPTAKKKMQALARAQNLGGNHG